MKLGLIRISVLVVLLALQASAWRPKTNLILAEDVLADLLADDSVTLVLADGTPLGSFAANKTLADAIRACPSQYRAGVIGPGAYPDVLTGQRMISQSSQGTCYWLNYLWQEAMEGDSEPRAFTAGFFVHAAGAIFGNTMINHYTVGARAYAHNEAAHTAVEASFDKHLPEARTADNQAMAEADVAVSGGTGAFIHDKLTAAAPSRWCRIRCTCATSAL